MVRIEYRTGGVGGATAAVFMSCQLLNCVLSVVAFTHSPDTHFVLKLSLLAILPIVHLITMFQWPFNIFGKWMTLAITDDAFEAGPRTVKWEDVESISYGLPFWRKYPLVRLVMKKEKTSFFTLDINGSDLTLFGHPFVYLELITHIKKRHSAIRVPDDFPTAEEAAAARRVLSTAILATSAAIQTALLAAMLAQIRASAFPQFQLLAILIFPVSLSAIFACRDFRGESIGLAFLRGAVAGTGISTPLALLGFYFSPVPAWIFSAGVLFGILILASGLIFLLIDREIRLLKPIMATVIIVAAAFSTAFFHMREAMVDMSDAFDGESPLYVWSSDGRYIADGSSGNSNKQRFLLNALSGETTQLRSHSNGDIIVWMDSSMVVRLAKTSEGFTALLIHHIRSGDESVVDKAPKISVSRLHPVSPDGKKLVWVTYGPDERTPVVKILNTTESIPKNIRTPPIALPGKFKWTYVDWNDENELVARGALRNAGEQGMGNMVLMRFNLKKSISKLTVFNHKAEYWYPISDFKHAFTESRIVSADGLRLTRISYVDLRTGETVGLRGTNVPSWPDKNGFTYRTSIINDQNFFLRFDLNTTREHKLCRIPDDLRLLGVSRDGRTAVFAHNWTISFATYQIYDIQTGKWRTLETSGFAATSTEHGTLVLMSPACSMWSPTSQAAVFETLECALPEKQIKAKTKLWRRRVHGNPDILTMRK
ncbi:MAG: hypothetical protein GXP32_08325 [Kiritimatiellaeota bacterium]|nr:hypothetical protein [Kiritimatiellota bacterium]